MGVVFRAGILGLVGMMCWAAGTAAADPPQRKSFSREELETVMRSLQERGFDRTSLATVFYDNRLRKADRVIGLNALNRESTRNYEPFLGNYALRKARRFRKRHFSTLWRNEQRFGVPMNVVVAILLVETQFGTARLPFRVMDVFTTLVVEATPDAVSRHFERLRKNYPELARGFLETRLGSKAEWALEQLAAVLSIGETTGMDVLEIKGSYAGAFGMPQFLPTSYRRWAVDGNRDRRVDLNTPADSLASISNFLVAHGWEKGSSLRERKRAVWEYNRSPPYVDAIFAISRKLSLPSKKKVRPS